MAARRRVAAAILLAVGGVLWLICGPAPRWFVSAFASKRWTSLGAIAAPDMRIVRQRHTWDCGYAALATLLAPGAAGERVYDSLRALRPLRVGGASVADLEYLAGRFGTSLQGRYVVDSSWSREVPPYLLLLTERHFVEVVGDEGDSVIIADPEVGGVKLLRRRFLGLRPLVILADVGRAGAVRPGPPR